MKNVSHGESGTSTSEPLAIFQAKASKVRTMPSTSRIQRQASWSRSGAPLPSRTSTGRPAASTTARSSRRGCMPGAGGGA